MAMCRKSPSVSGLHLVSILVVIVTLHACHGHSHSGHTSSENPELKLIHLDRGSSDTDGSSHEIRTRREARTDVEDLEDHSGESDPDQLRLDKPVINLDLEDVNGTLGELEDFRFEEKSLDDDVSSKANHKSGLVQREFLNVTGNATSENTTESLSGLNQNDLTGLSGNSNEHGDTSHGNANSSHYEESSHSHDNHDNHHHSHEHSESERLVNTHNSSESHDEDHPDQVAELSQSLPAVSKGIIKKLFLKYGDGQSMNFEGFEHMLENIGLGNVVIEDHQVEDHFQVEGSFVDLHEDHDHSMEADHVSGEDDTTHAAGDSGKPTPTPNRRKNKKRNKQKGNKKPRTRKTSQDSGGSSESLAHSDRRSRHANEAGNEVEECIPVVQLYNIYSSHDNRENTSMPAPLTADEFLLLCPLLIYQLDAHSCHRRNQPQPPCQLDEATLDEHCRKYHHSDYDHHDETSPKYQSRYHGHEDDEHDDHGDDDDHTHHVDDEDDVDDEALDISSSSSSKENAYASITVWGYALLSCIIISLVGLASVAVVPIMHKVIYNHLLQFLVALAIGSLTGDAFLHLLPHSIKPHNHISSSNDNSHGTHALHSHGYDSNEYVPDEEIEMDRTAIWIGLVALSGVYFFFLMERIMAIVTRKRRDKNREKRKRKTGNRRFSEDGDSQIGAKLSGHRDMTKSCEEVLMVVHSNKDVKNMAVEAHNEIHQNCDPGVRNSWAPGHSHEGAGGHHHSHQVPGSVSSVAWMVIMGDGLHNFSDGLAIGAAFASSLTSGLSTSIAVFCHELPHELGDFAVLLRAGMSVKQALVYNCVSSVLSLLGMVIGIVVGNMTSATTWIFAIIAGMFIYIALVDMLPELTSVAPKDGENPCLHLLLQSLGILTGAAIMLVIAVYEDRIRIPNLDT